MSPSGPEPWLPWPWIAGAIMALAAIGGLAIASTSDAGTGYAVGLALFGIATLGIFALISASYGPSPFRGLSVLPVHGAVRWAVGAVVGVIAIAGLFHAAARPAGSLAYYDGLGVFVVAVAYEFVLLKDWFDRRDRS